jgi:hypothetical protein
LSIFFYLYIYLIAISLKNDYFFLLKTKKRKSFIFNLFLGLLTEKNSAKYNMICL